MRGVSEDGQSILWSVDTNDNGYEKLRKLKTTVKDVQIEKNVPVKVSHNSKKVRKLLHTVLLEDESMTLEFKSSSRWDYERKKINKDLEKVILKSIVAFMNSEGGTLVLGVQDDKTVIGLKKDIGTLRIKNIDGWIQYIMGLISSYIGSEYARFIKVAPVEVSDKTVCLLTVGRADEPVFFNEGDISSFYVRAGNTTRQLNSKETYKYILKNWD